MKFTLSRRILIETLTPIQGIIPLKTTLPSLQNVKITAKPNNARGKGILKFEATDLDIFLSRTVPAEVELEGSLLVSARRLYEIVRELPDLEVTVEQKDLTLTLSCQRCVFRLPGIGVEDFPEMPAAADETSSSSSHGKRVKLRTGTLLRAIDKVSFAISSDESRPTLCGLLWQISEKEMKLVATDGHRLALMSTGSFGRYVSTGVKSSRGQEGSEKGSVDSADTGGGPGSGSRQQVIVPQKALRLLELLLKPYGEKSEFEIDVGFGESRVGFAFSFPEESSSGESTARGPDGSLGYVYLSSRLISGIYPDYNAVLPKDNDKIVRVGRDELIQATRRVAIFSDPYTHLVKFSVDSGRIGLFASSPQGGEACDEIMCEYDGDAIEMGYNAHYVLDVLKKIESEQIEIELRSPVDAGIFVPTEDRKEEKMLYLLMPIRLLGQ